MTEMIDLMRAFESQQRMITVMDGIDDLAVNRVGSLNG
jgi:flagellar basal body rod protein FlgG